MQTTQLVECVVVGSGPGGSLIANRLATAGKEVTLLEAGPEMDHGAGIAESVFKHYWNGGIVPMLGPFVIPFGQAKVLGGGTQINGALYWPTPNKVLAEWRESIPGSVYESSTWVASEAALASEFSVSSDHQSYSLGNIASRLLREAAQEKSWQVVQVPRAIKGCQNLNRCASGCPVGAKMTAEKVMLKEHIGIDVRSSSHVTGIEKLVSGKWKVKYRHRNKIDEIISSMLVLCAGATESSILLRKSALSDRAGHFFQFHINFKIIAKFKNNVDANFGTILTDQVQEFMADRMLFMASNFTNAYVASSLSHLSPQDFKSYMSLVQNLGIYTVMIRPEVNAKVGSLFGQTYVSWGWDARSFLLAKRGLALLAELLFAAKATEIVLPLKTGQSKVRNLQEAFCAIESIRPEHLIGVSVHGMSACKMGHSKNSGIVDLDAKVWGHKGLYVVDSSILPSNTGESPQGTILSTAEEIFRRWNI